MLTNRDIVRVGFSISSSVSFIISNNAWRWPPDWEVRFPELFHMQVLMIQSDREDVIMWRDRDDIFRPFFVACARESIRLRADVVPWYNVMWFSYCIPSHCIHLWLVVKQKLKSQDRNSRLFKKKIASVDRVIQVICHIVRLKLVSFMFKKVSARSPLMLDRWKVPSVCVTHDGSVG
nr:reverse transcriptase domain, reverse transcriptase zinc-binding domain protein [Tanacetum cinerariifolium]